MILMIDNYDSFTYNLVQYLTELGATVKVVKNDCQYIPEETLQQIKYLVVSPGPQTPSESGASIPFIQKLAGKIPILGVCLGHQCIATAFGGKITQGQDIMHGKTSNIYHNGLGIFEGLNNPFRAMRYHSLIVSTQEIPESLEITAWTQTSDGKLDEIMGLKHKDMNIHGVQFHPESILSEHGHLLLQNFLNIDINVDHAGEQ